MEAEDSDWKLKLRYGKIQTPFRHFTAIAEGVVGTCDIKIYETAPSQPPGDKPHGYDIKFTPFNSSG